MEAVRLIRADETQILSGPLLLERTDDWSKSEKNKKKLIILAAGVRQRSPLAC